MTLFYEWYTSHFKEYLSAALDQYAAFLPAVVCTYYQQQSDRYDLASKAGYTTQGSAYSYTRFRKILNVPLFLSEPITHTTSTTEPLGVTIPESPTGVVMFSKVGIVPRPDDHIVFPIFSDKYSTTASYQVTSSDPAVVYSTNPYTEEYQAFKLSLKLNNDPLSELESKVVLTEVYIDRYNKFLPPERAITFSTIFDLFKQVEKYLHTNRNTFTYCCAFGMYSFLDSYFELQRVYTPILSTYLITNSEILPSELFHRGLFSFLMDSTLTSYTTKYVPLEYILGSHNLVSNGQVLRRLWNRHVLVPTVEQVPYAKDIVELMYSPTEIPNVLDSLNHIANDRSLGVATYSPINSNISRIYNMHVSWLHTQSIPPDAVVSTWHNPLEAAFLYTISTNILLSILS